MKVFLRAARVRARRYKAFICRQESRNPRHPRDDADHTRLARDLYRMNSMPFDKPLDGFEYAALLGLAARLRSLAQGTQVHMHIMKCRLENNWKTTTHIVRMYGKCGCPSRALRCFECLHTKKPSTWAAIIMALADNGMYKEAKKYFCEMLSVPSKPDEDTFLSVLQACVGDQGLKHGKKIHAMIKLNHIDDNTELCNALITMYGRCHAVDLGVKIFRAMPERDALSWVSLVATYALNGHMEEASYFTCELLLEGLLKAHGQNGHVFAPLLKKCDGRGWRWHVEAIHGLVVCSGMDTDLSVRQELMKAYGRCSKVSKAKELFDEVDQPDKYLWTTMLRAYALDRSKRNKVLELLEEMKNKGVKLTDEMFYTMLSCTRAFEEVKKVHAAVVDSGYRKGPIMKKLIIQKYKDSQEVPDAWEKFRQLQSRFKQKFY